MASIHDPLCMCLSTATARLLEFLDTLQGHSQLLHPTQRTLLAALATADAPLAHADTARALNTIAHLLKHDLLSIKIVELYRPLVLDLVARWLAADAASSPLIGHTPDHPSKAAQLDLESMARAFALILPIVPQVKR